MIKPRTNQKHLIRHITRLYRKNNEKLFAYSAFLGKPTECVLNQLVETVLGKDKDFQTWREQNPGSHGHVPRPGERSRAKAGAFSRPTGATASRPTATAAGA